MKIVDLDGNVVAWNLKRNTFNQKTTRKRSELHSQARDILHEIFPTLQIFEEVPVPVKPGKTLYLDFFIPLRQLAVEVHGQQHFSYTPHFHGNINGFIKQKQNDSVKEQWCQLNEIELISLPYDEDIDGWRNRFS